MQREECTLYTKDIQSLSVDVRVLSEDLVILNEDLLILNEDLLIWNENIKMELVLLLLLLRFYKNLCEEPLTFVIACGTDTNVLSFG